MSLSIDYLNKHDPLTKISQFQWKYWNRLYMDHFKEKEDLLQYLDYVQNKFGTDEKYKIILKKAEISSLFLASKDNMLQMFMTKKFYKHDKTNFSDIIRIVDFLKEEEYPQLSPTKIKVNISQKNFKKLFENKKPEKEITTTAPLPNTYIEKQTEKQIEKQIEKQTEKQIENKTEKQIENKTEKQTENRYELDSLSVDHSTDKHNIVIQVEDNIEMNTETKVTSRDNYCSNLHDIINLNGIEFVDLFSKFGDENIEKLLKKISSVRFLCKV